MLRKSMIVLAITAALTGGLTADAFARGGGGGGGHGGGFGGGHMGGGFGAGVGRGAFVRNPTLLLGSPAPRMPTFENRIPAPLSSPAQTPIINGPVSEPAFRGMTGMGMRTRMWRLAVMRSPRLSEQFWLGCQADGGAVN
jgi:hypothetical protein